MRSGRSLFIILLFIVVLLFLYAKSSDDRMAYSNLPENSSWVESLFGDDDDASFGGGGGGGRGFYLSSLFEGFEFRFRVKDYRAMDDDDLSDADNLR